jgi:hypothetical protein
MVLSTEYHIYQTHIQLISTWIFKIIWFYFNTKHLPSVCTDLSRISKNFQAICTPHKLEYSNSNTVTSVWNHFSVLSVHFTVHSTTTASNPVQAILALQLVYAISFMLLDSSVLNKFDTYCWTLFLFLTPSQNLELFDHICWILK